VQPNHPARKTGRAGGREGEIGIVFEMEARQAQMETLLRQVIKIWGNMHRIWIQWVAHNHNG
jgi:hypothetical protein